MIANRCDVELAAEEPNFSPWCAMAASAVIATLLRNRPSDRAMVVAVDGRSGSGKSTMAGLLAAAATDAGEQATLLGTDDVAWWQARFDWDRLLAEHVLAPVRRGEAVCWRPPAWIARDRKGAIEVPAATTVLFVEGVGSARRELTPLLDRAIWVQSDADSAHERGIARDCALWGRTLAEAETVWDDWMTEELPHLAADRPWERADLVVAGNGIGSEPRPGEIAVAAHSPALGR